MNYTTGRNEAWKANNVYDLAGNFWDWTTEADSSGRRVRRGGGYYNVGSDTPASGRDDGDSGVSNSLFGFRLALYL